MCRMFAYAGDSREELATLVDRLSQAAEKDKVGMRLGMKKTTHPDGWGFVVRSNLGCQFETFATAIFEDKASSYVPETKGRIHAVFHARRATKGSVNKGSSQPFFGEAKGKSMYLAHNGSLDMGRLSSELKLNGVTDSQMILNHALARGFPVAVSELTKYVDPNSALNLIVLERIGDSMPEILVIRITTGIRREQILPSTTSSCTKNCLTDRHFTPPH
jgi:predicted glutamine amidotransferase